MKRCVPVPVFVVALLIGQLSCDAQPPIPQPVIPQTSIRQPPVPQSFGPTENQAYNAPAGQPNSAIPQSSGAGVSLIPSKNSLRKFSPLRTGDAAMPEDSFNGYADIRATPDLGAPGSAGSGFHHFSMPFDKYTQWYRPRAASLTAYQRCAPDSFRPRGLGHLFAPPCDGYRMEYEPYVLGDGPSKYGPAYIARMPDPRCSQCDCSTGDCKCK
jgi:hypothetical protein